MCMCSRAYIYLFEEISALLVLLSLLVFGFQLFDALGNISMFLLEVENKGLLPGVLACYLATGALKCLCLSGP